MANKTASTMPTNTSMSYLDMKNEEGEYEKLIDIKDYPDDPEPETLDTTTLSDTMETSIPGIDSGDSRDYTCNYIKADYDRLKKLEGTEHEYRERFGADGEDGAFVFKGQHRVLRVGKGVNEVREMTLKIYLSEPITSQS
jgi:hypothetical protein